MIVYEEGKEELLNQLGFLWDKLRLHHRNQTKHFVEKFENYTYIKRKEGLLKKANAGELYIVLVKDEVKDVYVGYIICSVNEHQVGEVDSIYIEPEYRQDGIGHELMTRGLTWLDSRQVERMIIGVGEGNEDVLSFYKKYGFYPFVTLLERKKKEVESHGK